VTSPHHYHRETIFTGAGWPYRCRCGEGDAIGGVRGDNCPVALREEIARLTGAVDAERAAVVAYLRGEAANALNILDVANDIEAGEHIAKEQG